MGVPKKVALPGGYQRIPTHSIRTPQQQMQYRPLGSHPFSRTDRLSNLFRARAEEEAESNLGPVEGSTNTFPNVDVPEPPKSAGPANVYGGEVKGCESNAECTFTAERPNICVGQRDIWNQGDEFKRGAVKLAWSDNYIVRCISIWDLKDSFNARVKYGTSFFIPKCNSLPQAVLASDFSKETWNSCELEMKKYKFKSPSMSIDPQAAEESGGDPDNKQIPQWMAQKCTRFRGFIERICLACELQTGVGADKASLSGLCDGIQGPAPAVLSAQAQTQTSADFSIISAAVLTFVGSGILLAISRRRAATAGKEALLGQAS